jgi:hypothetical protein
VVRPNQRAVAEFLHMATELGFQPRLIGQSDAPVFPRRVGNWWLEPVTPTTVLPARAEARLARVVTCGVKVRAAVLFHEIPQDQASGPKSQFARSLDTISRRVQREAPVIGGMLGRVAITAATSLAKGAVHARDLIASLHLDPCLVVVTEDGQWVEIDRWYS